MNQSKKNKKPREPELFEHSYIDGSTKENKHPPYIYLLLIAFVVFTIIWKGFVAQPQPEDGVSQDQRIVTEREVAKPDDMVK